MRPELRKALDPYLKVAPYAGIGVVLLSILVASIFWVQRGAHVELVGSIQKVRTLAPEENSTVAIIDFRFHNPSDYAFVVRRVEAYLTKADGTEVEGAVVSDVDAKRVFEYYPALGQKFNDSLTIRTKVAPKQSMDRMLAVRFELPEQQFQHRKGLRIHVVELDGPESDIREGQAR